MDTPSKEVRIKLITQEMDIWINTRFLYQTRYRVNKSVGSDANTIINIELELVKCNMAIDSLNNILTEIEGE